MPAERSNAVTRTPRSWPWIPRWACCEPPADRCPGSDPSLVCADAERLPLPDGSVDLIISNFHAAVERLRRGAGGIPARKLAPRGFLSFTTLGPDTLKELRAAWIAVDSHSRVNQFIDMHDIGDALVRAGFAAPVLDAERYTLDLHRCAPAGERLAGRWLPATPPLGRPRGLTTPRKFAAMQSAYEVHRSRRAAAGHLRSGIPGPSLGAGSAPRAP